MKVLTEVLRKPIVTEKATLLKENERKVVLEVSMKANKKEIKKAAEALFGVSVESVKTSICRGKIKRIGKTMGKTANRKKAVLTLAQGDDLDVFGVVAKPTGAEA